jgi:Bacterial Ig-like domain/HYR domain/Fibronectin type III domain/CARDB
MTGRRNREAEASRFNFRRRFGRCGVGVVALGLYVGFGGAGIATGVTDPPPPTPDGFQVLYVDANNGTDIATCGTVITTPCKTLYEAGVIGQIGDNDLRIFLAPGLYEPPLQVAKGYELIGTGASPADVVLAEISNGMPSNRPGPLVEFYAAHGKKLVIANVTFAGAEGRPAISSGGDTSMSHVVFKDNPGGAFENVGYGTTTADHLTVTGNGTPNKRRGGAMLLTLPTVITDSTFSGNTAYIGGAIFSGSFLALERTAIVNNSAQVGAGGISAEGQFELLNSTVVNNSMTGSGAGLDFSGANGRIVNSTISGNVGLNVGGMADASSNGTPSVIRVVNSIIAGNRSTSYDQGSSDPDCRLLAGLGSRIVDEGHNIVGSDACADFHDGVNGTRVGTRAKPLDPRLEALTDNGGATLTMADNTSSPGWAAGDAVTCINLVGDIDQRNVARGAAARGTCDIGAYDLAIDTPPAPARVGAVAITDAIQVAWEAPPGYSLPITTYTVRCLPNCGAVNVPAPASTYRWAGLTAGQSYQFTVQALSNVSGPGIVSTPSAPVQFQTAPGLVSNVVATASGTTIDLNWSAPTTGGGVVNYAVTCSVRVMLNDPNGVPTLCDPQNGFRPGLDLPLATHLHLTNAPAGVTIQFSVFAQNVVGSGFAVQSNPVTIGSGPGIPTLTLDPADDTGPSNSDGVTAKTTLHLGGTTDANTTVTVQDGSTVVATAAGSTTGTWTAIPPVFSEGPHHLTATVTSGAVTVSATPLDIIVDSLKPLSTVVRASAAAPNQISVGWNRTTTSPSGIEHWEVTTLPEGSITNVPGAQLGVTLDGFVQGSTHSFSVIAMNRAGVRGFAAGSPTVTVPVVVVDRTAPIVTVPATLVVAATSWSGATVGYTATATDDVDGNLSPICVPGSGALFPIGTTTVSCSATDRAGNVGTATFLVSVELIGAAPTVTALAAPAALKGLTLDVSATATATGNAAAIDSAQAWLDATTGTGIVLAGPFGTSSVNVSAALDISTLTDGTHTVYVQATDSFRRVSATASRTFVVDRTAPVMNVPTDVFTLAASGTGTPVTFAASAVDAIDGSLTPVCSPASGATFLVGSTTVSCTATDAAGNSATSTFPVTVTLAGAAPTISRLIVPTPTRAVSITVGATARAMTNGATITSARVSIDGAASSSVAMTGRFGQISVDAKATLGIAALADGSHTISVTALDSGLRSSTVTATFLVDRTAPTLNPVVTPNPVTQGRAATVTPNAVDTGSGVARVMCGRVSTSVVGPQSVSCTATDRAGNTKTATASYTVTAAADLVVVVDAEESVQNGGTFPVTVRVENRGPSAAVATVPSLTFDPTFFTVTNLGGAIQNGGTLTWPASSVASGRTHTVRVTFTAIKPGSSALTGAAGSTTVDPNLANNTSTRTIRVR